MKCCGKVERAGKRKCYFYPLLSHHPPLSTLFWEGSNKTVLPTNTFPAHRGTLGNRPQRHGRLCSGPHTELYVSRTVSTHTGWRHYTPSNRWNYWPVLTAHGEVGRALPGRKQGECSSSLLRTHTASDSAKSLQLNCCFLSTEVRTFQNAKD